MSHTNDSNRLSEAGYDRLAKHYHLLERPLFGKGLQRARVSLLPSIPTCERALVLGDGDGRLLEAFCRAQPDCKVISVDQSQEMLKLQQQRIDSLNATDRVTFVHQDARTFQPTVHGVDLLIVAFFLDCFTSIELTQCLPMWIQHIRRGGWLYVVDFHQPKAVWKRTHAKMFLRLMHGFFRWQTKLPNRRLVDIQSALNPLPIELIQQISLKHELIRAQLFRVDFMRSWEENLVH